MLVRLTLSFVLALAPAAQAQVVGGRAAVMPVGGVGLAPISAPQLSAPGLTTLSIPTLGAPLAAPVLAPALTIVSVAPVASASPLAPQAARALAILPAAAKALPSAPTPEKARETQQRFDELRAAFDEKNPLDAPVASDADTPDLLRPDAVGQRPDQGADEPPTPPKPAKTFFGFSRPLAFFLMALVVAQVGVEAQTAALPPLIAKIFGNVSVAADMGVTAYIADLVGTILAPITAKKLGLKRGYVTSTALRVATGGLIAGLLATNMIGLPALMALLAVDNILYGISFTLEKSIPAVMVDQNQAKLEKFKAARQTAIETVAAIIPIATGALIAYAGFLPALLAFPVAMALAMGVVSLTLKLPQKIAGANAAPLPGPQEGSTLAYMKHLGSGIKVVARTPKLLFSLLTYSFVYAPTPIVYWLLAPAFGLHLAGDAAHAVTYAGTITGMYSVGSILGALFMMRSQRKERDAARMRSSMLKWTALTGISLVLFGAMALPGAVWATITWPAIALFVFGIPQIMAKLKLESYFQSQAPKGAVDDATAVLEGVSSIFIAGGLWWFGRMLAGTHIESLGWLAAATVPLMVPLLILTWALARASKPKA